MGNITAFCSVFWVVLLYTFKRGSHQSTFNLTFLKLGLLVVLHFISLCLQIPFLPALTLITLLLYRLFYFNRTTIKNFWNLVLMISFPYDYNYRYIFYLAYYLSFSLSACAIPVETSLLDTTKDCQNCPNHNVVIIN